MKRSSPAHRLLSRRVVTAGLAGFLLAGAGLAWTAPPPAANFLVEWRIQPVGMGRSGDLVITSSSATVGNSSGYGPGAVVVGTARVATPQAVRVANGKEGSIQFDDSQSHLVYEMSYAAQSSSESTTDASTSPGSTATSGSSSATVAGGTTGASRSRSRSSERGAEGREVVVHRVNGLRVTPHWKAGDSLELDVALTHSAPTDPSGNTGYGSRASRDIDVHTTVQMSFDDWQTVAVVGDGGEELQVRVSWR